jgi:hypothetical protein
MVCLQAVNGTLRSLLLTDPHGIRDIASLSPRRGRDRSPTRHVPDSSRCGQPYVGSVLKDLDIPTPDHLAALDELSVNTIRTLAMDAVQAAGSGHPGTPMAMAVRAQFGGHAEKVAA